MIEKIGRKRIPGPKANVGTKVTIVEPSRATAALISMETCRTTKPIVAKERRSTLLESYVTYRGSQGGSTIYSKILMNRYVKKDKPKTPASEWLSCSCGLEDSSSIHTICRSDTCENARMRIECNKRSHVDSDGNFFDCGNMRLQLRQYAKTEAYPAGEKGYGLYALENIPVGALVSEYVGEVIDAEECYRRIRSAERHVYCMGIGGGRFIDASHKGNLSRFINHSCDPNCETQKWFVGCETRIAIIAVRPISKGTEVTFDYQFETVVGCAPHVCLCGAEKCRGTIETTRGV